MLKFNKNILLILLLIIANFLLVKNGLAQENTPLQKLGLLFNKTQTMEANFELTQNDRQADFKQYGVFVYKRPNLVLWKVSSPFEQHIISDGEFVYQYDLGLEQVIKKPLDSAIDQTPILIIGSSISYIDNFFVVREVAENNSKRASFELIPKNNETLFDSLVLKFNDNKLAGIVFNYDKANYTAVKFNHISTNNLINNEVFDFELPQAIDLIEQQ